MPLIRMYEFLLESNFHGCAIFLGIINTCINNYLIFLALTRLKSTGQFELIFFCHNRYFLLYLNAVMALYANAYFIYMFQHLVMNQK